MYVVDGLDTVGDYSGSEYVRVTSQNIGSWRVPSSTRPSSVTRTVSA